MRAATMIAMTNKPDNDDGDEDDANTSHSIEARGGSEKVTRMEL